MITAHKERDIFSNLSLYGEFIHETQKLLIDLSRITSTFDSKHSKDNFNEIFRIIHNIKGSSMTVGLDQLSSRAHLVEEFLLKNDKDIFQVLVNFHFEANKIIEELVSKSDNFLPIDRNVKSIAHHLEAIVYKVSKKLNKKIVLEFKSVDLELDHNTKSVLENSLTHILRNACDHGIECQKKRLLSKKEPTSKITVNIQKSFQNLIVEISDDGAGMESTKLIFNPYHSTKLAPTEISGRGMGLSIVKESIEAMGGSVKAQSVKGKGSTFILTLPLRIDQFAA